MELQLSNPTIAAESQFDYADHWILFSRFASFSDSKFEFII